ncbi:glycosyltransferase family 4 protein [Paraclostridium sordellii]|uniref:glycosyltransferase family 4 protein n=1 Tax=Paraclostridium sordellii TaxID=1505 RepID=UPI0005EA1804|nr:glycosyltransferase family 4 protein [Paeniclostridium sordellii]CEQ00895.1 glycosyltransferase [[Clostridium] sordellii] [Paeniclostridium sordellii]
MNILIIRNSADKVNINSYNLQEIGIARALIKKGHNCDIVYYTDSKCMEYEYINIGDKKITIYWCPAIKILNNAIYIELFKNKFLSKYDVVQTSEYNQIMTYLLSKFQDKPVVLYHGPYKDLRIKKLNKLYDKLFLKSICKNIKFVISKSVLSEDYLLKKGLTNISTVGVGLDIDRFNFLIEEIDIYSELDINKNTRILLYVGRLEERRNIKFILDVFKSTLDKEKDQDIKLLLIGDGNKEDKKLYFSYAEKLGIMGNIIYLQKIQQSKLRYVYEISDVFLLPTKYEIFGMVLLESMYFGLPVITSRNGGSLTIIENQVNGIVIDEFDINVWSNYIIKILRDDNFKKKLSLNASNTIKGNYTWDILIDKYIAIYNSSIGNI